MRPVTEAASTPGRGFCQSTRQPSRTVAGWPVVVSFVVSFSYVRRRPARTTQFRQPRSRSLLTYPGLSPTDLESVSKAPVPTILMLAPVAGTAESYSNPCVLRLLLAGIHLRTELHCLTAIRVAQVVHIEVV